MKPGSSLWWDRTPWWWGSNSQPGLCINSLLQRRRLHLSAVKKSSGVLHRPRCTTPQKGSMNRTMKKRPAFLVNAITIQ